MEGDDRLRALTRRTLEGQGYRVLAARNGEDALQLTENLTAEFDLMLTDVVMPGMGGVRLAKLLRETRDMPVLFVSGYTRDAFHEGKLPERARLMQEPYLPSELLTAIREGLDS